jgi:hypothetical protein
VQSLPRGARHEIARLLIAAEHGGAKSTSSPSPSPSASA